MMLRRKLPYAGLLHEVVEHNGVVYLAGIVSEDLSLDMSGQTLDVLRVRTEIHEARANRRVRSMTEAA